MAQSLPGGKAFQRLSIDLIVLLLLEAKSSLLPSAFLRCHILKESITEKEQFYSQSLQDDELFML